MLVGLARFSTFPGLLLPPVMGCVLLYFRITVDSMLSMYDDELVTVGSGRGWLA